MLLIEDTYRISREFPQSEIYGLTNQLRRSVISIALNIAEGSGADSDSEFHRFLIISRRSLFEVICGLEIAQRLHYVEQKQIEPLFEKCDELSAMLSSLKKKLKFKDNRLMRKADSP